MNPAQLSDGRYDVVMTMAADARRRDWPFDREDTRTMLPNERCVLFVETGLYDRTCKLVGRDGFSTWARDGNFRLLSPLEALAEVAE